MRHEVISVPTTRQRLAWPLAVAALLALQLALIAAHDPWRDEYQALQLALQSPDLAGLLANLRYEGHPPLWFLLLRGMGLILPAALVLPVTQALLAATNTLLIAARAPFPRWVRLAIAASPFFLFEYGVVARGLSLGVTLLVIAVAARRPWVRWTAVALLPAVEFQFGLLSLGLLALAWRDRWWSNAGVAAWALVSLAAAWSIRPASDLVPAVFGHGPVAELARLLTMLGPLLVPIEMIDGELAWGGVWPDPLWVVGGPAFLIFAWSQLRGRPLPLALFAGFVVATAAMTALLYPLSPRHVWLIAVWMVLLMWREAEQGRAPDRAFAIWCAILAATGALAAVIGLTKPFDHADTVSAWIRAHRLEGKTWTAYPESLGQGISALSGREMLSLPKGCTQAFIHWDHPVEFTGPEPFGAAVRTAVARHGELYLATDQDISGATGLPTELLASWPSAYDGTAYRLYRIAAGRTGTRPAPCPPARLPLALHDGVDG